jgi:hypothetical protein
MESEPPIFAKNEPGAKSKRVSKRESRPQWQEGDQGKACPVN